MRQKVLVRDLGRISYEEGLRIQKTVLEGLVSIKRANRKHAPEARTIPLHQFLFCEHDPVFTLGRTGKENHLLLNASQLKNESISFHKTNRGGDITFHGPGQIVGYPILDMEWFFTDVHKYVRYIEEAIIRTLRDFEITGKRIPGYTGVWLDATPEKPERKICAIGIHLSRWVSMHGFAFNVNTDLHYFTKIIPCGISDTDKTVTSLKQEVNHPVSVVEVKNKLIEHFADLFAFDYELENSFSE
ncbi:MAG: lipoyl(octanoyl) transferase LipB [Saprospiraceae bacterium]|nr:lipoyl(octanoyl) transferase LipB [Saprospiraceae bacterium]